MRVGVACMGAAHTSGAHAAAARVAALYARAHAIQVCAVYTRFLIVVLLYAQYVLPHQRQKQAAPLNFHLQLLLARTSFSRCS